MRTRPRRGFGCLLVVALLGTLGSPAVSVAAPATEIDGNTYTSPTFGHTVTWDDTWFVISDESDQFGDYLALTNGTSSVVFAGTLDRSSVSTCVTSLVAGLGLYGGLEDVEPLIGGDGAPFRGEEGDRAYAAIAGTTTFDDGATYPLATYIDCQPIVPGVSLLSLVAFMPVEAFADQLPLLQALLAGVVTPADASGDADESAASEGDEGDAVAGGEPAPVFISRQWRIAVAGVVRDETIEAAGLEAKAGKEWIVVVADVTNWGHQELTFSADSLGLVFAGDDRRYEVAPNSSRAAVRALDLDQIEVGEGVELAAGDSARLALVYQVPAGAEAPVLSGTASKPGLPLDDDRGEDGFLGVRPPIDPPDLETAEVVEAIDGELFELRFAGTAETVRARLIGVDAPTAEECFDDLSTSRLTRLVGQTVWIERDPTERSGATEKVYLWSPGTAGDRVLVNQEQLAGGYAQPRPLAEEARFAAWLGEGARFAEQAHFGLWNRCQPEEPTENGRDDATPSATATAITEPAVSATTEPSPTPDVTPTPEVPPTPTPDAPPDEVTIETFEIGYRPDEVTVAANTDVTFTVTNAGASEHTFSIPELNVSIAIPPGEEEVFTLNLPAGDYVFFCERPGHRADGMEGEIHVE